MAESQAKGEEKVPQSPPKPKPRPIVRIGILLISHSTLVSLICCTGGLVALFLLPILAKTTYISENALMPGSANPMFSGRNTIEANQLVKDIMSLKGKIGEADTEIPKLLAQRMETTGAEVYHHEFHAQTNQFYPLHFFSTSPNTAILKENISCLSVGVNSVGIIRAPRGDGKEAIVLVTPYNSSDTKLSEALSLSLGYSIFSLLSRVNWLAKDVIWVAADSRHGEYSSVSSWLNDYHTPVFFGSAPDTETNVFRRAGTMAAALVIKVVDRKETTDRDTLGIYSEASNGQMPNLDLINIVNYLAVHRQGFHVKVEKLYLLLNSAWLRVVGEILELIGKVAKTLNPDWKFGISSEDYVEGAATLASSLYHQALGIPTGSHGAFRDYQVDAITLEISSKVSLINEARRTEFLLRGGRLLEGVIRSVNNLLEKFHQSFFLYLLTSPGKFISVGVYMIAFALLLTPLPISAASLYSTSKKSQKWLHSAKVVFLIHFWAVLVSLSPSFITKLPITPTESTLTWASFSGLSLVTLYAVMGSPYKYTEWMVLKAVMIAVGSIGLGLMSIINYATAQIGVLIMVPLCLLVKPLKVSGVILGSLNLMVGVIGFPPLGLVLLKGCLEGFQGVSLGDFWIWAESLWAWNSATYLYLSLVHLPCWVLCMHILFHPC